MRIRHQSLQEAQTHVLGFRVLLREVIKKAGPGHSEISLPIPHPCNVGFAQLSHFPEAAPRS